MVKAKDLPVIAEARRIVQNQFKYYYDIMEKHNAAIANKKSVKKNKNIS